MTYFGPALDPPLGGSGQKTTTLVRDLEYFLHTKFHQNPSSGSGEEVENVNCLTDDGRRTTDDGRQTTDGRRTTDAGQRVITIGHWSLRLLCPNKQIQRIVVPRAATNLILKGQSSRSRSRHGANWKGLSQGSCMPNINAVSLILQKIWARLNILWQTERQRDGRTDERMSFNVPNFR